MIFYYSFLVAITTFFFNNIFPDFPLDNHKYRFKVYAYINIKDRKSKVLKNKKISY